MKILKNAGTYEILELPDDPIHAIATAARTCYQSQEYASVENDKKLVKALITRKHHAMLEFCEMTVRFNDICRGFTHEMVRHRLCNFAQESTRYVDENEFRVVVPPHKDENEQYLIEDSLLNGVKVSFSEWMKINESFYKALRKNNWKPEDARQVLPIAIKSQIVVKANIREWRHIFEMRTSDAAHWEIRGILRKLLKEVREKIPILFDDVGVTEPEEKR